jgi:acyl-CoA reductase-like NAD-dependent aldehyde dehydrogenase
MKALDKAKTDDLNDEQKKLLAELIKNEMMQTIEGAINSGSAAFADAIKNYIRADEEAEKENQQPPPKEKKSTRK